jgi:hypothetical protein
MTTEIELHHSGKLKKTDDNDIGHIPSAISILQLFASACLTF